MQSEASKATTKEKVLRLFWNYEINQSNVLTGTFNQILSLQDGIFM